MNKEVQKATWSMAGDKHGPYKGYSASLCSETAKVRIIDEQCHQVPLCSAMIVIPLNLPEISFVWMGFQL